MFSQRRRLIVTGELSYYSTYIAVLFKTLLEEVHKKKRGNKFTFWKGKEGCREIKLCVLKNFYVELMKKLWHYT